MKMSTLALAFALAAGFGLSTAAFAQTNTQTAPAPAAAPAKTAKPAHKTVQHKSEKTGVDSKTTSEAVKK
jgi:hypothetical protein